MRAHIFRALYSVWTDYDANESFYSNEKSFMFCILFLLLLLLLLLLLW